jgi:hypothetical protein
LRVCRQNVRAAVLGEVVSSASAESLSHVLAMRRKHEQSAFGHGVSEEAQELPNSLVAQTGDQGSAPDQVEFSPKFHAPEILIRDDPRRTERLRAEFDGLAI